MRTRPHHRVGRHELGQNFLTDPSVVDAIVGAVEPTDGPIFEIGPGDGALTWPLERLGRPLTCIEVDPERAESLAQRSSSSVTRIHVADFLHYRLPTSRHVLVGNIPFHVTTPVLRRILAGPGWTEAVLLVQWEVARKRAGVGGSTMMTAQWWPWYDFRLLRRVDSDSFSPRPSVDGGLLAISRRRKALVPDQVRGRYQRLVKEVFTGRGRGLAQILANLPSGPGARQVTRWMRNQRIPSCALPRDLSASQWVSLLHLCEGRRQSQDHQRRPQ